MISNLKIAFVGDVMCGDSFYALGQGVASSLDKYGKDFLPDEIVHVLSRHDLVLCNVECVLSDVGRKEHSLRSLHMRGRPEAARYLAQWGITVAHVANNHILEQGIEAAVDTVHQLEQAGIKAVGAGKNACFQSGIEAAEINCDDRPIAIIAACFRDEKYAFDGGGSLNEVLQTIDVEANKGKLVIVSAHWGDELIDRPNLWQKDTKHRFVEAGATLVIGHHPHVVQGIEVCDGRLIAYSLGNFIFDSSAEATGWSVILSVTVSGTKIVNWEAIPIVKNKDHRPMLAQGERKNELEKEIARRCELASQEIMNPEEYEKEYALDLQALKAQDRRKLWLNMAKNFVRYRPIYWPQIIWRPIQRRMGRW